MLYKPEHILQGILKCVIEGCQWRSIDSPQAPWRICYYHFRRLEALGLWQKALDKLRELYRAQIGKDPKGNLGIIDSQSVRVGKTPSLRGYDGGKKIWGRKRHLLVDPLGILMQVKVTPANLPDLRVGARMIFDTQCKGQCKLKEVHADGAYRGMKIPRGTEVILGRNPCKSSFRPIKHRWKIERSFAWLGGYRRFSKDYESRIDSSEAVIKIAFLHLISKRLAKAI